MAIQTSVLRKKRSRTMQIAAMIGAVIGALFARPVIRPWLAPHLTQISPITLISLIPWVLFSLYWEIEAKNSAPALSSESKTARMVHVVLSNIAVVLIILPIRGLNQRFEPDALPIKVAGLAAECAGLALAIWARRVLGRNWSGEITIKEDHELVRSGPYKLIRHPIYTALLVMCAGTAIVSGQMHALAGLALAILAYLRKTRLEETNLVNAFGTRYSQYREDTWALLPGIF